MVVIVIIVVMVVVIVVALVIGPSNSATVHATAVLELIWSERANTAYDANAQVITL